MKIFAKFPSIIKILLVALAILSVAMCVFAVISLFDVYTFLNWTVGQAKLYLPTGLVSLIISVSLLTIHYKADDKYLRIKLLFFDILGGRIRIENILNVVYTKDKMYISYIWKGQDPVIANVMISQKKFDQLKNFLMAQNTNIVFFEDKDEISDSKQ